MHTLSIPSSQLGTPATLQAMLHADQVEILPDLPAATTEQCVLQACRDALSSEHDYATKAVIAGMLLNEFRHSLICQSHSETGRTNDVIRNNQHSLSDKKFILWIEAHGIAKPTAYRWIAAAERVAKLQLHLPTATPFSPFIDIEGAQIPLSTALTTADSQLSTLNPQLLQFRQSFFDFMQDKTLAEATRAAVDGESPAHRITRAANGKSTGGKGNNKDRKAWHTFIAEKLSDVSGHLKHWRSFTGPQKECACETLTHAVEKWPTPVLEHIAKAIRLELTRR